MLKSRTVFWVGVVAIIGAAAFVLTFGSLDKGVDADDAYEVYAVFDDATGLVDKSQVKLSGIAIGMIESIELDPDQPAKARVTMLIEKRIALYEGIEDPETGRWKSGAVAMRKQSSLLGDYYVAIAPGVAGERIRDGGEIKNVVTESGLGAVIDQLEDSSKSIFPKLDQIASDIQAVTGSLRKALGEDEGVRALQQIRDDVRTTTHNIAELSGEFRTFAKEEIFSQGATLERILANVEATTSNLRGASGKATRQLDSILGNVDKMSVDLRKFVADQTAAPGKAQEGTVASAIKKVDRSAEKLEGTLESAKSVASKIDEGKGTVGRLINDDKLIDDFERVVSDIGSFTSGFSRIRLDVDIRSEYMIQSASFKHYVSLAIRPKPDRYWLFQLVDDPRGNTTRKQRTTISNDPDKPPVLTETITETTSDFKFTAQFAKRWHFLTFRYGIMESTGGFGIDANLLEDSLRFKLDLFQFNFQTLPRVRLLAAWNFMKYVYIAAGVDDILNDATRDYFVGLGVTFTDGDLKSVLPFLPIP